MKTKLFLLVLVLWSIVVVGLLAINRDSIRLAGEAKAIERIERARLTTDFLRGFYGSLGSFSAGSLNLLIWVGWSALAAGVYLVVVASIERRNRPKDGIYPLRNAKLRLPDGSRATVITDPNRMLSASTIIVHDGDRAGVYDVPSTLSEAGQLQGMAIGRQANNLQAGGGHQRSAADWQPRMRVVGEPTPAPIPAMAGQAMSVSQAFIQSSANRWVVGRSTAGVLATFDPAMHVHCAVLGSTGTGKSEGVGMMLLAHALRMGWQTVILDGKGGADWSHFQGVSEYHRADYDTFPDQVDHLVGEYQRRRNGEADPPPLWVVVEEYGDLNYGMSRAQSQRANDGLATLLRMGRDVGMHLCFIDQYPERWEAQIIQNARAKFVHQLADGAIVKEYKAHELSDRGEFFFRGQRYNAFHAKPHVERLLGLAAPVSYPMLIDGSPERVGTVESVRRETSASEASRPSSSPLARSIAACATSQIATRAPQRRSVAAMAKPMPEPPAVTSTLWPSRPLSRSLALWCFICHNSLLMIYGHAGR